MRLRIVAAAFLVCAMPAHAEWRYINEPSDFEGDIKVAITIDGKGHALGIRCANGHPEIFFATPDTSFPESALNIYNKSMPPVLLLRIDGGDIRRIDSQFHVVEQQMGVRASSFDQAILPELAGAKHKVSAAIDLLDILQETEFDARGSKEAIAQLSKECGA